MKRYPDYLTLGIIIVWIVTLFVLAVVGLRHIDAQDAPQEVTTFFTFSCYITDADYATVLVDSNGEEHYTFDNIDGIDTDISSAFTTHAGVYPLGRVSIYGVYSLSFIRDDGVAAVISMAPDWQTQCDKVNTPLEGTPEPSETPTPTEAPELHPVLQVMSTGRTCVVKYPQIILVCNG